MAGIGLGVLMATIDASIVNVALPTLVETLHTDFATVQWVVISYVLVITSLVIGVARLGDMLGRKRVYTAGLALFTLGSLLCGMAPTVGWLIGFRALQGCGAVMAQALGAALVAMIFPASERGRALGIVGSIVAVGLSIGPALGGLLIGWVGWRTIFLVNVPVGLMAAIMVGRFVPTDLPGSPNQKFDPLGAVVLLATLVCYAIGMTLGQKWGFGNSHALILLVAAALGFAFFLIVEGSVAHPMIKLGMFRNALFSINLIMSLLVFVALAGTFILPFFLELVLEYRTEQVGLMMMVVPVTMGIVAPASGMLADRFGPRGITLLGLTLAAAGCVIISTLDSGVAPLGYILRLTPLGLGLGMFLSPNNSAILGEAPREHIGIASGLLSLSRTLGNTSGFPLMGALFSSCVLAAAGLPPATSVTAAPVEALQIGVTGVFRIASVVIFCSAMLAALAYWIERKRHTADTGPRQSGSP
ncbi:MAG: MFS transporter [Deltaproteobacteria bacterium]|nr:MFS transporter [Deltaproteobacteria bacterium]